MVVVALPQSTMSFSFCQNDCKLIIHMISAKWPTAGRVLELRWLSIYLSVYIYMIMLIWMLAIADVESMF